ncbi:MAG TPA: pilin [Dokdonella sp.]
MQHSGHGFTLIELTIAIAIVAVLAAVALPAYQDYLVRSQVSEGFALANGAKTAVWDYLSHHGGLPTDNRAAGLPEPESITGQYVGAVAISAGVVRVTFAGSSVNRALANGVLRFVPDATPGSLRWSCSAEAAIDARYLPTGCR